MNSKLFTFSFSVLSFVFLTISLSTTSCNFFQVYRTVFNLPKPKSSTFVFRLFKLVAILINLLMINLSTSAFEAKKPLLVAKSDVSTPLA